MPPKIRTGEKHKIFDHHFLELAKVDFRLLFTHEIPKSRLAKQITNSSTKSFLNRYTPPLDPNEQL